MYPVFLSHLQRHPKSNQQSTFRSMRKIVYTTANHTIRA